MITIMDDSKLAENFTDFLTECYTLAEAKDVLIALGRRDFVSVKRILQSRIRIAPHR